MNDTVIEAMSQFEIPRPTLRSSVWPRQVAGRARPPPCAGSAVSLGNGMQHPYSCSRYFVVREFQEHGPPLPVGTPSCQHFRPSL